MTRDEIIRMAREAKLYSGNPRTPGTERMIVPRIERFAALVAAAEREACAQVCEELGRGHGFAFAEFDCSEAIRARGEQ